MRRVSFCRTWVLDSGFIGSEGGLLQFVFYSIIRGCEELRLAEKSCRILPELCSNIECDALTNLMNFILVGVLSIFLSKFNHIEKPQF